MVNRRPGAVPPRFGCLMSWLFAWRLAYGGIIMAIEGMREMHEASNQQTD